MTSTLILDPTLSDFHEALADAYLSGAHDPTNPRVAYSYRCLSREIQAQYENMLRDGVTVTFTDVDPYADANAMFDDLDNRSHLAVYTGGDLPDGHPMLRKLRCPDGNARLTNLLFRAVHDYYGHFGGALGFGGRVEHIPFSERPLWDEERAYLRHRQMFTRDAWLALTCETRAQTAVNNLRMSDGFGPQKCVDLPTIYVEA